jgi:hypothetical protein
MTGVKENFSKALSSLEKRYESLSQLGLPV